VIEIEPTHKSPRNCQTQNLYFIINIILHINTISNVLWPRTMLYCLSVLCVSISLAPDNAFHLTIDCWIWWVHESPCGQSMARWCFCGDQSKVSVLTCSLASFHFTRYSSRRKRVNGLVGTWKRLR